VKLDVEKVAALAYLNLSEEEKKGFEREFQEILNYVDQIQSVPMSSEQAKEMGAFHVQTAFYNLLTLDPELQLRDDSGKDEYLEGLRLSNEEAVSNAPKASGLPNELLYEVPSIIEG